MSAGVTVALPNFSVSAVKNIAVIGAGTVGLSTAFKILEELGEKVQITIIAESFLNQTTSFGSGGLWEPYQIAGTPDELINGWGKHSFDHFLELHNGPHAADAGVQLLTNHILLEEHEDSTLPSWRDIVFNFKELTLEDIAKMNLPSRFVKGFTFSTLVIEQKYYMTFLTKRLEERGVTFQQRKVNSLQELVGGEFDAVINCTGLGSAELLNDEEMYPIRGQVLRVRAPWMKNVWFWGKSYIIPNVDTVVLGGTAQKGNWSTVTSIDDTNKIMEDICELFPAMKDAVIESVWAGLRPGRTPLRLGSEVVLGGAGGREALPVFHCYGHGGSGITLAMGCAHDLVTNHLIPQIFPQDRKYEYIVRSKL